MFLCCCKFWLTTECTNYDLKLLLGTNQTDSHGSALPAGLHFSDIRDQETNLDAWIKNENKTLYLISRKFDTWIRLRTEKGEKCRNSPQICHFFDVLIDVLGSIAHKFAIHLFDRDLWETLGHFSSQALTPTSTLLCPPICFPFEAFLVLFFRILIWLPIIWGIKLGSLSKIT